MPSPEQSDPKDENTKSSVEEFDQFGYFFAPIAKIGSKVEELYQKGCAGDVNFQYFKDDLLSNKSANDLLACYPKLIKFNYLWGIVEDFYCWDNPSTVKAGMVIYLLQPNTKFECLEDSHRRKFDIKDCDDDYSFHLSPEDADRFSKKEFDSGEGGVLFVHPVLGFRTTKNGHAIIFGTKK